MSDHAVRQPARPLLLAAFVALLTPAPACTPPGEVQVEIRVESDPRAAAPDFLLFSWLDCRTFIQRDVRVPERGTLLAGRSPLAVIVVRVDSNVPTRRGALVRGFAQGVAGPVQVSVGTAVVDVPPFKSSSATVRLFGGAVPEGPDGIPDELDWCAVPPSPVTPLPPPVAPRDASPPRPRDAGADGPLLTSGNAAPMVSAGADLFAPRAPADVMLMGTATDDGLPRALALAWSQVSGPAPATLADPHSAATGARFSVPGVYVLRLAASDGQLDGTADVTVTVLSLDQGVTGLWHFDDGPGPTAKDSSGHGLDATLVGGGAFTMTARLGRGALDCHGTGAQATVPALSRLELGAGDLTVSAWVRASQSIGPSDVVLKWPAAGTQARHAGFVLGLLDGGAAQFKIYQGDGATPVAAIGGVVTDGQWHHLLGRKTAGEVALYIDGRRAANLPHGFPSLANDEPLQLGGFGASGKYDLNGEVDEVVLFDRALSDLEIAGLAAGLSL
jgi:hypothetical protein